jgi:hypothetical protein
VARDKGCGIKINIRILSYVLTAVYAISIIPMLIIALFNYPSADDYSMALEVHQVYEQTGSVFASIGKAIYMGYWYYMNWTGYFFSSTLTSLCPSVFNEKLYAIGTFVFLLALTAGVMVFMKTLLNKVLHLDKYVTRCVSTITLIIIIQCMNGNEVRNEAFYWYSGAINYMFMFGLGLLWLGMLINVALGAGNTKTNSSGIKIVSVIKYVLLCLLSFLMGGANYMTALSLGIMAVVIMMIAANKRTGHLDKVLEVPESVVNGIDKLILPAVCELIGLVCSIVAPGNAVRSSSLTTNNPIKAVMQSFFYCYKYAMEDWMGWHVIVLLALMTMIVVVGIKKVAETSEFKFSHPFLFSAFCLCLAAANATPPLYATGNIEAGRIKSIFWAQFVVLMVLAIIYVAGWIYKNKVDGAGIKTSVTDTGCSSLEICGTATQIFTMLVVLFLFGSALCVHVDEDYYTGTSALSDIVNGSAAVFASESADRLVILNDSSVTDAALTDHTEKPELLFFSDISEDADDWINKAVAEYYHKNSVILQKNN